VIETLHKKILFALTLLSLLVFAVYSEAELYGEENVFFIDGVELIKPYWSLPADLETYDGIQGRILPPDNAEDTTWNDLSVDAAYDFDSAPLPYEYGKYSHTGWDPADSVGFTFEAFNYLELPGEAVEEFRDNDFLTNVNGDVSTTFNYPDEFYLEESENRRVKFSINEAKTLDYYYRELSGVTRIYVPREYCSNPETVFKVHDADEEEFFLEGVEPVTALFYSVVGDREGCHEQEAENCQSLYSQGYVDGEFCYDGNCVECNEDYHCTDAFGDPLPGKGAFCVNHECVDQQDEEPGEPEDSEEPQAPETGDEEVIEGGARVFEAAFYEGGEPLFVPVYYFDEDGEGHTVFSSRLLFTVPNLPSEKFLKNNFFDGGADFVEKTLCLDREQIEASENNPGATNWRNYDPRLVSGGEYGDPDYGEDYSGLAITFEEEYGVLMASAIPTQSASHRKPMPFSRGELIKDFQVLSHDFDHGEGELELYYELSEPADAKISVQPFYLDERVLQENEKNDALAFFDALSASRFTAHFYGECPGNPFDEGSFGDPIKSVYASVVNEFYDSQQLDVPENALCAVIEFDATPYPEYFYGGSTTRGLPNGLYRFVLAAGGEELIAPEDYAALQWHDTNSFPKLAQYKVEYGETSLKTADYEFEEIDFSTDNGVRKASLKYRRRVSIDSWGAWHSEYGFTENGFPVGSRIRLGSGDELIVSEPEEVNGVKAFTLIRNVESPDLSSASGQALHGEPCAGVSEADEDDDGFVTEKELKSAQSYLLNSLKEQFDFSGNEYELKENDFCASGLACVLARSNDALQPDYKDAYLMCIEPDSLGQGDECNLVRIPQAVFGTPSNWGVSECAEPYQCREDYAWYASDSNYRCGPQWINLYRLADECGDQIPVLIAREGEHYDTEYEGSVPEYSVQPPGDRVPDKSEYKAWRLGALARKPGYENENPALYSIGDSNELLSNKDAQPVSGDTRILDVEDFAELEEFPSPSRGVCPPELFSADFVGGEAEAARETNYEGKHSLESLAASKTTEKVQYYSVAGVNARLGVEADLADLGELVDGEMQPLVFSVKKTELDKSKQEQLREYGDNEEISVQGRDGEYEVQVLKYSRKSIDLFAGVLAGEFGAKARKELGEKFLAGNVFAYAGKHSDDKELLWEVIQLRLSDPEETELREFIEVEDIDIEASPLHKYSTLKAAIADPYSRIAYSDLNFVYKVLGEDLEWPTSISEENFVVRNSRGSGVPLVPALGEGASRTLDYVFFKQQVSDIINSGQDDRIKLELLDVIFGDGVFLVVAYEGEYVAFELYYEGVE
jgi:hypothetical protein